MSNLLATPTRAPSSPRTLLVALALIVAAVALFAALPALRAGRLNTVDALALGRASLSGGASRAARVAAALHLPATARLGVKDAFTSRSRATLTVGALTMMVITLVAALSMEATYDRVIDDPALRAKPWDVRVQPGAVGERPRSARPATSPGSGARRRSPASRSSTPRGQEVQARALGDGFERFAYAVPDGRMFAAPRRGDRGPRLLRALRRRRSATRSRSRRRPAVQGHARRPPRRARQRRRDRDLPRAPRCPPDDPHGDVIADFAPGTDGAAVARDLAAPRGVAAELVSDEVRQERADVRPIVYGSSALLVAVGLVNLLDDAAAGHPRAGPRLRRS